MQVDIGYRESIDDLIAYLHDIREFNPTLDYITLHMPHEVWENEKASTAFHKLSTCWQSCGCTGYSPKVDCPDMSCFCNGGDGK